MNPATTPSPFPDPAAPKGPSNLRLRVIWGALAAALLIGCTFGGPLSFAVFFAAVQAVILKEFYRIMRASEAKPAFWLGIVVGLLIFLAVNFVVGYTVYAELFGWPTGWTVYPPLSVLPQEIPGQPTGWPKVFTTVLSAPVWLGSALVLLVLLVLREILLWPHNGQPGSNIGATVTGLLYVSLPMAMLSVIAYGSGRFEPGRVFCLIFFVWAADTGAYFAGKNFGKHKLAPSISPGKTWEGWAGGAALTLVVGWAAGHFLPDIPLSHRLVAAGVVAVFGPLGDLAESMLKRSAGVKDSGTFLPGHGGLLDRFDAFLLVLPVLALLQVLLG
ncbi:phosphatidate cytidylyltransferase [Hymenobacter cheonanensis]|uniref:phosphatidate cytidylyltransferase n=1 Tax=Hymenobacter sp. CA2-7 TaxID=3063993 RepID=UPI002712C8A6|nr:phosphatidate cytidylyltransferase [Hymenobacter sp. CA2-7]MDO7884664.1 phosphatidate cytidylyltransferase [Hymenobacter sp. CA2-7]